MTTTTARRAGVALGSALLLSTGLATQAHAAEKPKLDLAVSYQVSAMKAPGAAGLVAIKLKNVGSERYFGEYPLTKFEVSVETVQGPRGVDRVITPSSFNGAHVRDLGFDPKASTRKFEVSLANAINANEEVLVANLSFGERSHPRGPPGPATRDEPDRPPRRRCRERE
ncbi:hypothetical protein [Mariniluteicoccus flavus]